MKVLIVVDMQNDFIDGSLGTKEAVGIVDRVAEVMDSFDGAVICTRDTHFADYLETSEGRKLLVEHCIEGTKGHALQDTIQKMAEKKQAVVMNKITFGAKICRRRSKNWQAACRNPLNSWDSAPTSA